MTKGRVPIKKDIEAKPVSIEDVPVEVRARAFEQEYQMIVQELAREHGFIMRPQLGFDGDKFGRQWITVSMVPVRIVNVRDNGNPTTPR